VLTLTLPVAENVLDRQFDVAEPNGARVAYRFEILQSGKQNFIDFLVGKQWSPVRIF
jgi:hypothetical protein